MTVFFPKSAEDYQWTYALRLMRLSRVLRLGKMSRQDEAKWETAPGPLWLCNSDDVRKWRLHSNYKPSWTRKNIDHLSIV